MLRPSVLTPRPSLLVASVAGAVAVILIAALLNLAPVLGFPFIDVPLLIGGIFTGSPAAAFWLGYAVFLITGWLVWPTLFALLWSMLPFGPGNEPVRGEVPCDEGTLRTGLLKGALWGAILWLASGLLLPVLGWLNQLPAAELQAPGLFGLRHGVLAPVGTLLGHLAYGVALGLVAVMSRGIEPLDTLGWPGYHKANAKDPPAPPQRATYSS